jgi:hypothetical protein
MKYVIFYGYAACSTDMRKDNGSIDLWQIQFSDCRTDMRKLNVHRELWQASIFARGGGACALVCARFGTMGEGRSRGVKRSGVSVRVVGVLPSRGDLREDPA